MRLLTRSDFDGLTCAAILEDLGVIDQVFYTHPKDLQDGKVPVSTNDVLANVPFVNGCGLWFDHHASEHERLELEGKYKGATEPKPSTARVIFDYYMADATCAPRLKRFEEMVNAVDKADSGQYTVEDIENPQGWMMLALMADPRTGLGYQHKFHVSNFDLMKSLPSLLRTKTIREILALSDFRERIDVYQQEKEKFKEFISKHSYATGDVIVIDLRAVEDIPAGNRFVEYLLYPSQNISIRLVKSKVSGIIMFSIGHSIFNRTSEINVGSMGLRYGGGGHLRVGTCQIPASRADEVLKEMIQTINSRKQ